MPVSDAADVKSEEGRKRKCLPPELSGRKGRGYTCTLVWLVRNQQRCGRDPLYASLVVPPPPASHSSSDRHFPFHHAGSLRRALANVHPRHRRIGQRDSPFGALRRPQRFALRLFSELCGAGRNPCHVFGCGVSSRAEPTNLFPHNSKNKAPQKKKPAGGTIALRVSGTYPGKSSIAMVLRTGGLYAVPFRMSTLPHVGFTVSSSAIARAGQPSW